MRSSRTRWPRRGRSRTRIITYCLSGQRNLPTRSHPSPAASKRAPRSANRILSNHPLQFAFHPAVWDGGLVELRAERLETRLQVETFGVQLRVQDGAAVAEGARLAEDEIEQAPSDAVLAPFALDRHPADFCVIAMRHYPGASNGPSAGQRNDVDRAPIFVKLDRFGHALLLDKDAAANLVSHLFQAIVVGHDDADFIGIHST